MARKVTKRFRKLLRGNSVTPESLDAGWESSCWKSERSWRYPSTFNVYVTGLSPNIASGNVPVIKAQVDVKYTTTTGPEAGSQATSTTSTNSSGSATVYLNDVAVGQAVPISVSVCAGGFCSFAEPIRMVRSRSICKRKPGGRYVYTRSDLTVNQATQSFTLLVNAKTDPNLANAFVIFSALYAPLNFTSSIHATLPNSFAVNYPTDTLLLPGETSASTHYDENGTDSGQTVPTIDYTSNVLNWPDSIAHEFGHMVAFTNGFANINTAAHHFPFSNIRGSSSQGSASEGDLKMRVLRRLGRLLFCGVKGFSDR